METTFVFDSIEKCQNEGLRSESFPHRTHDLGPVTLIPHRTDLAGPWSKEKEREAVPECSGHCETSRGAFPMVMKIGEVRRGWGRNSLTRGRGGRRSRSTKGEAWCTGCHTLSGTGIVTTFQRRSRSTAAGLLGFSSILLFLASADGAAGALLCIPKKESRVPLTTAGALATCDDVS